MCDAFALLSFRSSYLLAVSLSPIAAVVLRAERWSFDLNLVLPRVLAARTVFNNVLTDDVDSIYTRLKTLPH
jgi:hypothetical protein